MDTHRRGSMFDRPPLSDTAIADAVRGAYDADVSDVSFLGLGHDANAWTFRADLRGGERRFLKVRRRIDRTRLAACADLAGQGIQAIVAPLTTKAGEYSIAIDGLFLVAYRFLDARPAAEVGLADDQWIEYGSIVGAFHRATLPAAIERALPHEAFRPTKIAGVERIDTGLAEGRIRGELAAMWLAHGPEIRAITERTATLAGRLQASLEAGSPSFVPCHGDVHTHNVLVEASGALRVVDWDELVMAPPERDLMFLFGSPIGLPRGDRELALFREGYGPIALDPDRLAYYHADWAIQDLVGYAEESIADGASPESRAAAFAIFASLFGPGDEVEVALR
jgi:spectinomycin phosphotransferase